MQGLDNLRKPEQHLLHLKGPPHKFLAIDPASKVAVGRIIHHCSPHPVGSAAGVPKEIEQNETRGGTNVDGSASDLKDFPIPAQDDRESGDEAGEKQPEQDIPQPPWLYRIMFSC